MKTTTNTKATYAYTETFQEKLNWLEYQQGIATLILLLDYCDRFFLTSAIVVTNHNKGIQMTTINFSITSDHGHYYGQPGHKIRVDNDGSLTVEENQDLTEIRRLVDLHQNGGDVAEGDVLEGILQDTLSSLAALIHRIEVADNSSGSLTVFEGKPYVQWELDFSDAKLKSFLKDGLDYDGAATPSALLTEFRQRHSYETPLEFTDRGWSYTTWSGTILIHDEAKADMTISIRLPLYRAVHEDGRKGFHFQLLNAE